MWKESVPVNKRVNDLLVDLDAGEVLRDGTNGLAEETVGDGQDVRLVNDGDGRRSLQE